MTEDQSHYDVVVDVSQPAVCVVKLAGDLDLAARDDLKTALLAVIEAGPCEAVIVDLDQVAFIDSEAIGAILDGYTAAAGEGIRFRLRHAHGVVRRVFTVLGLLPWFDDEDVGTPAASTF